MLDGNCFLLHCRTSLALSCICRCACWLNYMPLFGLLLQLAWHAWTVAPPVCPWKGAPRWSYIAASAITVMPEHP
eukprot:10765781-Lingulodinium_polyedra.AAC.1